MGKILVAFFSHAGETYYAGGMKMLQKGNANIIAEKARNMLKADMFEIKAENEYPQNYNECCKVAKDELMTNKRPKLLGYLEDLDDYEDIVLVYPCWWGTMPMPVFTFLEHYDLSKKNILPICTHEGSGMGKSESDLSSVCENSNVCAGLAIQGTSAENCDAKLKGYFKANGLL